MPRKVRKPALPFAAVMLSCEHGGYSIPKEYRVFFRGWQGKLRTHFGYDKGALPVAKYLAKYFGWPLLASTTSRLLIDLNRPRTDATLFSRVSAALPIEQQRAILRDYYQPYWRQAQKMAEESVCRQQKLLHLSVHSFTPVRLGVRRNCDIGLLFDPRQPREAEFCRMWQKSLRRVGVGRYRIRLNYPYRGDAPALTTSLRQMLGGRYYAGVEIEINQKLARRATDLQVVMQVIARSLQEMGIS